VSQEIHLQVNSDLTAAFRVLSWFEQLNRPPLPNIKTWWQCQTLLHEGFTNIVEHAHKDLPLETQIVLEAVRSEHCIEIRIWSYGKPFDLKRKLREIAEFEDNDRDRGRGLKIIAEIADGFSYEPTSDARHCLWMKKCY
jgi:serine/threonine-protein kinase RsbW